SGELIKTPEKGLAMTQNDQLTTEERIILSEILDDQFGKAYEDGLPKSAELIKSIWTKLGLIGTGVLPEDWPTYELVVGFNGNTITFQARDDDAAVSKALRGMYNNI